MEEEGMPATATIEIPSSCYHEYINDPSSVCCTISNNETVLFRGRITRYVETSDNSLRINLISDYSFKPDESANTTDPDIIRLFYNNENLEIPEIFCRLNVPYYDRTLSGVATTSATSSLLNYFDYSADVIHGIEKMIIKDSLKIERSFEDCVSAIELEICASWISRVDGDIDITSKVSNMFRDGRINTLTPKKLEALWPRFGDRLMTTKISGPSKYFVGISRLLPENTLHMNIGLLSTPTIDIGQIDDVKPFNLPRHWYNHRLSICYGYDQGMSETVVAKIVNPLVQNGVAKKIKINLRSVQEFIDDIYAKSFFTKTGIGNKAYKHILEKVGVYIASSMRNVKITFEIPFREDITCRNWVVINGIHAKITRLNFMSDTKTIIVEAQGFGSEEIRERIVKNINSLISYRELETLDYAQDDVTVSADIIKSVVVENDGASQIEKLMNFINSMKMLKKLTKENYRQLINKFLSENSTTINIITRPLKTNACISKIHDLGTSSLCLQNQ